MTEITPKTVTVKQGYKVILEKQGFTRNYDKYSVTMFYGRRPNGKVIYSVPVFKMSKNNVEMVGEATSLSVFSK